ncbi:MAG TPA: hypothetical protein VGQ00_04535 [Candidatus Norongarragalinales archaeon]|jgi:hypothetical protein|nr:hypothetical protein [Candidatus Norongarragalinales archaeon]
MVWLEGIIINTILGLAAFFLLNLVGVKISYSLLNIFVVAILGLLGVGFLLVAKVFGYPV